MKNPLVHVDSRRSVQRPISRPAGPSEYVELDVDAGGNELNQWLEYLRVLGRRKLALSMAALCGAVAAFGISLYQTPTYRASATLEIQITEPQQPFEGIAFMNQPDPFMMQTQAQLLTSRMLQDRVTAKLAAKTDYATASPDDGTLDSLRSWLGLPEFRSSPAWREALGEARGTLTVTPVRDTRIVRIASESPLPHAAADYVNTLAGVFIEHSQEERWSSYQATGAWLDRAQEELKGKLEESEKQLLAYSDASGLIVTSKAENIAEQKLLDLQAELSRAQAQRIEKEAVYRTARSQAGESLGARLDGGLIASYEIKLSELRRELADLTTTLTDTHPKVKRLQAQIDEVQAAEGREQKNILSRFRSDFDSAVSREQQLMADFGRQSEVLSQQDQKLIRYKMLLREVETYRTLYDTMLQKGKEASIASALRPVSARLIDAARPPRAPARPNLPTNLALGLGLGSLLGVGIVLLREHLDQSIQAPGAVSLRLNVRELGILPSVPAQSRLAKAGGWKTPALLPNGGKDSLATTLKQPVELATWNWNGSVLAESVRTTLTSILMSGQEGAHPQVVLVTSPSPREGKSTVLTNLGIAMAEIRRRVLLVDADLRRPRLHTIFGQANTWGLGDLLQEDAPIDEYATEALARKTHIPGLYVLPTGPGGVSASRLLHSDRMSQLFNRLRKDFDAILIDSPPVLSVADARVVSQFADAVVLVLRAGQTTRDAATMAVSVLEADGTPVLGTVLNDWTPRSDDLDYNSYAQPYSDTSAG